MLRLRPYKKCDAQHIVEWLTDEVGFRRWCADRYDHYPIVADDMNRMYSATEEEDTFFPFTAFDEEGVAGHLIMRFTDEDKTDLRFGFIIVSDKRRGKGYGRQMLELALSYAYDILKVNRVTLGVFENNPAAYRCYRSVGFEETGERENMSILGEEWTCIVMEHRR